MRRRALLAGLVAVAGLAAPLDAQTSLTVGGCQVQLAAPWTRSAEGAAAPGGSTVRIMRVPNAQMVIGLLGREFRPLAESPALLVFARELANEGRQFRSVTRTEPACAADVIARSAEAVAGGESIARSIRAEPR